MGVDAERWLPQIHAKEILRAWAALDELLALHTGQSVETIARDTERDRFMSADEARDYGLIDSVLGRDGRQ